MTFRAGSTRVCQELEGLSRNDRAHRERSVMRGMIAFSVLAVAGGLLPPSALAQNAASAPTRYVEVSGRLALVAR